MLKHLLLAASFIILPFAAIAQEEKGSHSHAEGEKGPHGGIVQDLAGYEAELVTSNGTVTLYLLEPKTKMMVPTNGMVASLLFTQGSARKGTLSLQSAGDRLEGRGVVPEDADVIVSLRTKEGKSAQQRFELGGHNH